MMTCAGCDVAGRSTTACTCILCDHCVLSFNERIKYLYTFECDVIIIRHVALESMQCITHAGHSIAFLYFLTM